MWMWLLFVSALAGLSFEAPSFAAFLASLEEASDAAWTAAFSFWNTWPSTTGFS